MAKAWVVTSVELGWDCVIGLFDSTTFTKQEIEEKFPRERGYVVHWGPHEIYTDLEEFD